MDLTDPQDRAAFILRYRRLAWISVVAWALFAVRNFAVGYRLVGTIDLVAAAITLAVLHLGLLHEVPRRMLWGAHLNLALVTAGLGSITLVTGHARSVSLWNLSVIPLFAAYQLGSRSALAWGAAAVAVALGVQVAGESPPYVPEFVPQGWELTTGQCVLISIVTAFALAARQVSERQVKVIREQADAVRRQARELEQARDEALQASAVKGQFLANMSHEIRTPLHGLLGMIELLEDTPLDDDQQSLLQAAQKSGDALLAVVNQILDFSKLESGRLRPEHIPFEPGAVLQDVTQIFQPAAGEKGLKFTIQLDPGLPPRVLGDPTRVRQVAMNLVSNAIKFTSQGSIRLVAAACPPWWEIRVEDTGIGIPTEQQALLFAPFHQVDSSTTRKYGGTGLGLAISRRLAELMGGSLLLDSQSGRGSTFTLRIPLEVPP